MVVQDKTNHYFSLRISPYRTIENKIDGVVITLVDVTKMRQAEKVRRLATIITDSNDAVTVLNLDGTITAWNKGAEKMYGYSEKEALKMNIYDFVPENKKQETDEMIDSIRSGKIVKSYETERIKKDRHVLDVHLTVTKLVDDRGEITAIAATERDNTEIKLLKADYERRIEHLKKHLEEQKSR